VHPVGSYCTKNFFMSPAVLLFSSSDIAQKYEIHLRSSIYLDDSHLTTITEQYIFSDDTRLTLPDIFLFSIQHRR
jgi:hypothetical protein